MDRKLDSEAKRKVGDAVKQCLLENEMEKLNGGDPDLICSAKQLAARIGSSPPVIYKLHSGEFSLKTLRKVEVALGRTFSMLQPTVTAVGPTKHGTAEVDSLPVGSITTDHWAGAMPVRFGGYTKELLEPYLGEFVAVSRGISIPDNLLASKFDIYWDEHLGAARFSESKRFTATDGKLHDYSQSGTLHLSLEIKNVHLLTSRHGALRLITLTGLLRDPDPVMYGAILTQVPEGGHYKPSKSTIHFRKLIASNREAFGSLMGVITHQHSLYQRLAADLSDAEKAIYTR